MTLTALDFGIIIGISISFTYFGNVIFEKLKYKIFKEKKVFHNREDAIKFIQEQEDITDMEIEQKNIQQNIFQLNGLETVLCEEKTERFLEILSYLLTNEKILLTNKNKKKILENLEYIKRNQRLLKGE